MNNSYTVTVKNIVYSTIAILTIFLSGCNNDADLGEEQVLFYWNQTGCADPWDTGQNDTNSETELAVLAYLENENILAVEVSFDNDSPLETGCEACWCGTGQRIIVRVSSLHVTAMENLGFYR